MFRTIEFDGTLEGWQRSAAAAIADGYGPDQTLWRPRGETNGLFENAHTPGRAGPPDSVPSLFVRLAASVSCHRDVAKWDALYAVLWRLQHGEPMLLRVITDPMVHRLVQMHRGVKRAAHKMKAFVRFRRVDTGDTAEDHAFVAWFEPTHHVVERTAPFFARRFRSMRWSILTPERSAHWDMRTLSFSDGVERTAAPTDDALEDLWRVYYANIFNPARLNSRAMRGEMPQQYWRNLPEARIIGTMQRDASARTRAMLEQLDRAPESLPSDCEASGSAEPSMLPSLLDTPGEWDPVHDPAARVARERDPGARVSGWCQSHAGNATIDFGVAGWTDPTLLAPGVFYPHGCTTPEARLRYYASRFSMVEVDATYYSMPSHSTAAAWAARTPDGFTFDIKAHALMTGHPTDARRLPDWIRRALPRRSDSGTRIYSHQLDHELIDEVWSRFLSALDPIRSCGKLGAIMLQFPRWFEPTRVNADMLRRSRLRLGDALATVEFRNRAWMEGRLAERTLSLLRDLELSYVVVDAPQGMESSMPPTVAVTDPRIVVFRLHGRRVSTWEAQNDPVTERYRYLYDAAELSAWGPSMVATAFNVARVHATFNNNHANYATTNAAEMAVIVDRLVQ